MLPHALLLTAVILWGWTFVATKILVAEIDPLEIFALRLAIGLPFVGLVLLIMRVPVRFTPADVWPLALSGAVLTLHFLIQAAGLMTTTATNTGWIISVTPLVLAALSFAFLRERISAAGAVGIVVATAGIVVLVSRGRVTELGWLRSTGDWLVLASTVTWATYTVLTRNVVRRQPPLAVTFAVMGVSAVVTATLFGTVATFDDPRQLSGRAIVSLLYLAIAGSAIGQWFWQEGVARLGATRAGLYLYVEPLATVALAVPLLGEPFGLTTVLGGGLVLAGVYLGQQTPRQ
jgi:drug/metabolite transporter (DMT)-like permease